MYDSLKCWCKQTIEVHRPGELLASGEVGSDSVFTLKGFLVNDSKLIADKNGTMVACKYYAYVIPTQPIKETDLIKMPGEDKAMPIRKLGGYFDGNTGELSIQVVYM